MARRPLSKLTFGLVGVGTMQVMLVLVGIACLELGGGFGPFCFFAYAFGISLHSLTLSKAEEAAATAAASPATPGVLVPMEAVKPPLALPKPAAATPVVQTATEPSPEWRALLDAIGYPRKKTVGVPLREKDGRAVLGWRFLVWLCAYGHIGEHTAEQVDRLYDTYTMGDHRMQWPMRIVKAELRDAKKWVSVRDSKSPTMWVIAAPPLARLKEVLAKRKVVTIPPTLAEPATAPQGRKAAPQATTKAEVADESTAAPFVCSPVSGKPSKPLSGAANDAVSRKPIGGLAELQARHIPALAPNLDAMGRLERANKAAWTARMITPHRITHRFSRARAA